MAIGNLTKAEREVLGAEEKEMPLDFVPLRYCMMRLTWFRWLLLGHAIYFAHMLVIVEISGRVDRESQFKLPTRVRIIEVRCMPSTVWRSCAFGAMSTGWPEQNGVLGSATTSLSSFAVTHRLSMNASWVMRMEMLPTVSFLHVKFTPRKYPIRLLKSVSNLEPNSFSNLLSTSSLSEK